MKHVESRSDLKGITRRFLADFLVFIAQGCNFDGFDEDDPLLLACSFHKHGKDASCHV